MQYIEQELWPMFSQEGLVVFAIGRQHQNNQLVEYKIAKDISFELCADPERKIYNQYAAQYIPRCYVIGKDGIVKYESVGFNKENNGKIEESIASELKK